MQKEITFSTFIRWAGIVLLIGACVLSMLFMALTYQQEQYLVKKENSQK